MLSLLASALVRLYPRAFRAEYGDDFHESLVCILADVKREGFPRRIALVSIMVGDVTLAALRMRTRAMLAVLGSFPRRLAAFTLANDLWRDVSGGLRRLKSQPVFAVTAVAFIAFAIAANTVIFSVTRTLLYSDYPYENADRLAQLVLDLPTGTTEKFSVPDVMDLANSVASIEDAAVYDWGSETLRTDGEASIVRIATVSHNVFSVLGVSPVTGAGFAGLEDQPGKSVAVLSWGFWQGRFGGRTSAIGQTLNVDGIIYEVAGVLPETFETPLGGPVPDLWLPMSLEGWRSGRANHWINALVLFDTSENLRGDHGEINSAFASMAARYPESTPAGARVRAVPLREATWGAARGPLYLLSAAGVLVLLVGSINLAALLLARGLERTRELVVRRALGASRWRIVRQLVVENAMLVAIGASGGVVAAAFGVGALREALGANTPRFLALSLDVKAMMFVIAVSVLTVVIFGLVPALVSATPRLEDALRSERSVQGATGMALRARSLLVTGQLTLSLVFLSVAAITWNNVAQLLSTDLGFDAANVVTFRLDLPQDRYSSEPAVEQFESELLGRLAALPGVSMVGAVDKIPLGTRWDCSGYQLFGETQVTDRNRCAERRVASPGYFAAMGVERVAGRSFRGSDERGAEPVAIVNASFARRHWPESSAVGEKIRWGENGSWRRVVGVVGDVRHFGPGRSPTPEIYTPLAQTRDRRLSYVVRYEAAVAPGLTPIRRLVSRLDGAVALQGLSVMEDNVASVTELSATGAQIAMIAAGLTIWLTSMGLIGVLTYSVTRRTAEIGLRMALGATGGAVQGMVLRQAVRMFGVAAVLGTAPALTVSRLVASQVGGNPGVAGSLGMALGALALIVGTCAAVPARRAARIQPARVLKQS